MFLLSIWEEEKMPDDFRDALIVSLYKNKGSKSDCGNYIGISLLSIAGKIFARVILNRLITVSEQNLQNEYCCVFDWNTMFMTVMLAENLNPRA